MKYKIILPQKYLRSHILNFGKHLKNFEFVFECKKNNSKKKPTFKNEISRKKTGLLLWTRRIFGIANIKISYLKNGDLLMYYGSFAFSNKPYITYIENGNAVYDYDCIISKNPIARVLFWLVVRRKNCKKIIFMSCAAKKSFLSSINYSKSTLKIIEQKSAMVYPLIDSYNTTPKKIREKIKLLFVGQFYMKGGKELVTAFEKLCEKYDNLELTIITSFHTLDNTTINELKLNKKIKLLEAQYNSTEMSKFYIEHDIFVLPTYRESFGLVLVEAIAHGMPIVTTDQFATTEIAINDYNALICEYQPLRDYETSTYRIIGRYTNPCDFYKQLFHLQKTGRMKQVEEMLFKSIEKFILNPKLIEQFSRHSLDLYNEKFHYQLISKKIEDLFVKAIK